MSNVIINGHSFKVQIKETEIKKAVTDIAKQINKDLKGKNPLFIGILNGSFIFAADLIKQITIDCDISFIKISSYGLSASTGKIKELIGLGDDVTNRCVVIVEDIVDTGNTIEFVYNHLIKAGAAEVKIATLLFKPQAYTKSLALDYTAIVAPSEFLVGYGLDYKGAGRNLKNIYVLDYTADEELKQTKNKSIKKK